MFESEIKIKANGKLLAAFHDALLPEKDFETKRAKYSLKKDKNHLFIKINASDSTAFRAIMNSLSSLLALVEKSWKLKNKF